MKKILIYIGIGGFILVFALAIFNVIKHSAVIAKSFTLPKSAVADGDERYQDVIFDANEILVTNDILYSSAIDETGAMEDLYLDFYQPENDTETLRPLVILVHGGGFSGGEKDAEKMVVWAKEWFAMRGFTAASINYRLRPNQDGIAIKESTTDTQAAIRFFRAHAEEYGINPNKIIVMGSSAGGITVLMTAMSGEVAGSFDELYENINENTSTPDEPSWACLAVSYSGAVQESYRQAHLDEHDSSMIDFHGTEDTKVDYNEAVATIDEAGALGIFTKMFAFEGYGHGTPWESTEADVIAIVNEHVVIGDCPTEAMDVPTIDVPEEEVEVSNTNSGGGGGGGSSKDECEDGKDNDNDGYEDYPDDLGCADDNDDSEDSDELSNPSTYNADDTEADEALVPEVAGAHTAVLPCLPEAPIAPFASELSYGIAQNQEVSRLQMFLNVLGYFTISPTGNFYSITETAVKNFQSANAIVPVGIVDQATQTKLNELYSTYPICSTDVGGSVLFDRDLYVGLVSDTDVISLQLLLQSYGFFTVTPTGNFYAITEQAVRNFQSAHGITPTGYVGPMTRAKLNSL